MSHEDSNSAANLVLLNPDLYFFGNTVDPDQLASDAAPFSTLIENTCLQMECCRLPG